MNIERVPIDKVLPWDKNPRGITTKDFARLKKQIAELGVYKPLIAYRENGSYVVLGGNMRIRALKEMGLKEVEVSVVEAETEAERIKYALSDNDRAGFYEEDKLAELVYPHIGELDLAEFKVDLGEALDLKGVVERYGPDIDDRADEVPPIDDTPALTKTGDLFTLGKHRLLCGDSTKVEDVARLMRGEKADLCLTDPPYGVDLNYSKFNDSELALRDLSQKWFPLWRDAATTLVFTPGVTRQWFYPEPNWVMCWFYGGGQFRSPWGFNCWQPILAFGKDPSLANGKGCRPDAVDMNTPANASELNHPCPKPLKLWEWLLDRTSMDNADLIADPFLGSGTTLIAAEKTGRICYGMEIDPKYCDVIIKRYADYAKVSEDGIRATREAA